MHDRAAASGRRAARVRLRRRQLQHGALSRPPQFFRSARRRLRHRARRRSLQRCDARRLAGGGRRYAGGGAAERLLDRLAAYDVLYFTAITLSILAPPARERFRQALAAARAAGRLIAFDSNYRPAGWADRTAARDAIAPFLDVIDMALPTFEDEQALWGDASVSETLARYTGRGAEVCVKSGAAGCRLGDGTVVPVPVPVVPVDTTAAGDAFNAAYLSARLAGTSPAAAALAGHRLAGTVIQYRGAIIPRAAMPEAL